MSSQIMQTAENVFAQTYKRFPLVIEKGRGSTLWDTAGRSYTDFVAGIAVCNLGHAHPAVNQALADQMEKLYHVSNLYYTIPQTELAAALVENSFADRVFFCNSGAEANEAAIKMARKYYSERGEAGRHVILSATQSFHGRTMAALSATGQAKIKKGFDPILPGFDFVPFNDIAALRQRMDDTVCAVLLEPIQGEGGVNCPADDYLGQVRELCDQRGALLIFDEIQTGMGRTGKLFAHEHFAVTPDLMTLAKALANGLPMGALLAREPVAAAFGPGAHASTFGGTPIVTAAALATLQTLLAENLPELAAQTGAYFKDRLADLASRHAVVKRALGMGLLLALELDRPAAPVVDACLERGFLINCVQERRLRFVPPLTITRGEIDDLVACLDEIFTSDDI
ncbi:MAG: aspartate aminotransferase family protein [Desulfosarcinaceae bacterium]|nr:aspartate aminotransferase family protein [Desulfosarcinaceae bacterium]